MEKYTEYLEEKTWEAADEDYSKEALLEVVKAFRTFDAALNEFLLRQGYEGEIEDVEQLVFCEMRAFFEDIFNQ